MTHAAIVAKRIGVERQPIAIVDGFHPDADALRAFAADTTFGPARRHYPGIRAPLPDGYFQDIRPALIRVLGGVFGHDGDIALIDASFAMVTTPPDRLEPGQRLPHIDATDPDRIALVHYLTLAGSDGTAFFRHRSTGFETIDADRASTYLERLNAEVRLQPPVAGYPSGGDPLFERTAAVDARYNRAVLYRSSLLHSGAIRADADLSADPARGRLTITAFLHLR